MQLNAILAPIDFSERSKVGLAHAAQLARHFDSPLVLLHVVPTAPYLPALDGAYMAANAWIPDEATKKHLRDKLDELASRVAPGFAVDKVVAEGDVAAVIAETAKERSAGLVVLPTAGYGAFRRLLLGSVAGKVLHDTDGPVLTGAHVEELQPYDPKPYERVACAVNLEEGSERVLKWAADFAKSYGAELSLLHAAPGLRLAAGGAHIAMAADLLPSLRRHAQETAERLLEKTGVEAEIVVETGEAAQLIPTLVADRKIDVLVIGRRGGNGLLSAWTTSAFELIRSSPCPVVSV